MIRPNGLRNAAQPLAPPRVRRRLLCADRGRLDAELVQLAAGQAQGDAGGGDGESECRDPEADGGFSWEKTDLAETIKQLVF